MVGVTEREQFWLVWVITSAYHPHTKIHGDRAPVGASMQLVEISLSRDFLVYFLFSWHDFCSTP